jgi:hypothetical protein
LALALLVGLALPALAQQPPATGRPAPRALDSLRTGRDTSERRDTVVAKEIVRWTEPDSVMRALLDRPGYSVTRYQGRTVVFDAVGRGLRLIGDPAAVAREASILVGDTITYNDSTRDVVVLGDTAILRDPTQNAADIVTVGRLDYNVSTGRARVADIRTALTSGETYYITAKRAVLLNDSIADRRELLAGHGMFTTCDLLIPHYHFATGEIKFITRNLFVARSAVLYISDVPVMWLPFIFKDLRSGRRSGITTPRFGIAELLRNSPTYRRTVENVGYYFAINDYMDAQVSMDWRSGARPQEGDPGYLRYNGEWRYRVLSRFLSGRVAVSYLDQQDGATNTSVSIGHQQDFSQTSRLTANINYVTSTQIQRRNEFVPYRALATIASRANYQQRLGPFSLSLGGSRTQYPGRDQVDQGFPTLSVTSDPIDITSWLNWTPSLSLDNNQHLNVLQSGPLAFRLSPRPGGGIDSVAVTRDSRTSTLGFETPFRIGGWTWRNSIRLSDVDNDFPESREIVDVADTSIRSTRVFARTFRTEIDWQTGISLPSILQGSWNISPSVSIVNIDPSGLWVRTELTGGQYVRQSKRLQYGLSASPTFFGLFPGFGPYSRFRHAITTSLSYSFSPAAKVSDEFLAALGRTRQGYLGSLAQNQVSLSFSTNFEAKLRSNEDSATADSSASASGSSDGGGRKINLLSMNFTPLSWDFERARATGRTGLTNDRFGFTARSDLLPGLDFGTTYSLFQGSSLSDTSRFKPYREEVRASFSMNRQRNPFVALYRVFGRAVPNTAPELEQRTRTEDDMLEREVASQQVTGSTGRAAAFDVPSAAEGWSASFTFSSSRQRPPVGGGVIIEDNDALICATLGLDPISQERCILEREGLRTGDPNAGVTTGGGPFIRRRPTTTMQSNMVLPITPNWSSSWQTTYDFEEAQFASHMVNLVREMHDWRATFSILKAPNGNFAFSFFIALKSQPDLKFDYHRQSYRRTGTGF